MRKITLLIVLSLLSACATNPRISKSLDELTQRFAGKKYSVEPVKDESDQYIIRIFNADVRKRRHNRQTAMSEICPYSKIAQVLAEKEDHKKGTTQLVVWCKAR